MIPEGQDDAGLKRWIVKRLEDISDADSEVLAEYVLALLRHESPEGQVRKLCIEQLEDFLKEHTAIFVDDVFRVIQTKSYLSGASLPQHVTIPQVPVDAPTGPARFPHASAAPKSSDMSQGQGRESNLRRKRSFNDQEEGSPGDDRGQPSGRNVSGERALKQLRRGGPRGGRSDYPRGQRSVQGGGPRFQSQGHAQGNDSGSLGFPGVSQPPAMPFRGSALAPPPPSPFPFDPTDPMTTILAMQAMGLPSLPGFPGGLPPLPQAFTPDTFGPGSGIGPGSGMPTLPGTDGQLTKPGVRCIDYDEKGFCALGGTCPYDHGTDHIIVPGQNEEYDPTNSAIVTDVKRLSAISANGHVNPNNSPSGDRGRGRGRGRGNGAGSGTGRRGRADFSHAGPNQDRSITTVVVENIPEEHFDEESVRTFFSTFGHVEDIQMQAYRRLSLVKFDSWVSAKKAYDSPKVVFDNRFVKVYWYKPEGRQGLSTATRSNGAAKAESSTSAQDVGEAQLEEIKKKQEGYQRAHEEKLKKIKETEESRRELEKRAEELLRSQAEEKKRLMERLTARTGTPKPSTTPQSMASGRASGDAGANGTEKQKNQQTEALKAQLAALEAEARSLGIDSALPDDLSSFRGRGRGRGAFRGGRGGYMPRERGGYDPSRGGYRGRGGIPYAWASRGGGANKLDNRTKKVAVSGVVFDEAKDEALRQYLLGVGEFEQIEPNPDRKDSQVVTFKDRFTAEKFISSASEIPSIGRVELVWVNRPLTTYPSIAMTNSASNHDNSISTSGAGAGAGTSIIATTSSPVSQQQQQPTSTNTTKPQSKQGGKNVGSENSNKTAVGGGQHPHLGEGMSIGNEDYDVADDHDRWMDH